MYLTDSQEMEGLGYLFVFFLCHLRNTYFETILRNLRQKRTLLRGQGIEYLIQVHCFQGRRASTPSKWQLDHKSMSEIGNLHVCFS